MAKGHINATSLDVKCFEDKKRQLTIQFSWYIIYDTLLCVAVFNGRVVVRHKIALESQICGREAVGDGGRYGPWHLTSNTTIYKYELIVNVLSVFQTISSSISQEHHAIILTIEYKFKTSDS